eukprot:14278649-Alexandrium_andersonii.AAC.1
MLKGRHRAAPRRRPCARRRPRGSPCLLCAPRRRPRRARRLGPRRPRCDSSSTSWRRPGSGSPRMAARRR